jgi:hypothetical protein
MTDWLKCNPFLGALLSAAALVVLLGGYFVFSQASRLGEEQSAFEEKKMLLARLQGSKPFPNQAHVEATEKEATESQAMLDDIAKSFRVDAPPVGPQAFQDTLSKMVREISEAATAKGITLPEDFYLGFEAYETQPPPPEATAQLALQLRSIHAVAKTLIDSKVISLGPITRAPLPGEGAQTEKKEEEVEEDNNKKRKKKEEAAPSFVLAPFDITFTADQPSFRLAFNRVLDVSPPIFVRLVAAANSQPLPPPKAAAEEPAAAPDQAEEPAGIKPVLGRETLTVDLRLASIATGAESP